MNKSVIFLGITALALVLLSVLLLSGIVGDPQQPDPDTLDTAKSAARVAAQDADRPKLTTGGSKSEDRQAGQSESSVHNERNTQDEARALRASVAAAHALPAERPLLHELGVEVRAAVDILRTQDSQFYELTDNLKSEMLADPLAAELGQVYRDAIIRLPELDRGDLVLSEFACGLIVCVGELQSHLEDASINPRLMNLGQHSGGPPVYFSHITRFRGSEDLPHRFRFLIAIDPDNRKPMVRIQP